MFKDQTSLIVFIVAVLLGLIGIGTVFFTQPTVQPVIPVETVPLGAAKLPDAGITYANALPNAGSGAASGGAPAGFGGRGGAPGGAPTRGGAPGGAPGGGGFAAPGGPAAATGVGSIRG